MSDSEPEYPELPTDVFAKSPEYPQLPPSAHFPLPTSPKMSSVGEPSGAAGKQHEFSFSSKIKAESIDKPTNVKLDDIKALEGQSNYNVWAATMVIILKGMKCHEIVVEGVEPADDADRSEVAAYEHLSYQLQAMLIQVVSSNILKKIVELESPHKMWTWLHTEYYRVTAYAFVY
jgi:hypothetical protein